jgi:DNA-binding NtrC family response regulator
LQRTGCSFGAIQTIQPIVAGLVGESPELYAQVEQILACALVAEDDAISARFHRDRAARIYESLRSATAQVELQHRWAEALSLHNLHNRSIEGCVSGKDATKADEQATGRHTLHSVAAAFAHTDRPELVARELVDVLIATNCVYTARATSDTENEADETIATPVLLDLAPGTVGEQRLAIGIEHDRTIQVVVRPRTDIESVATLNAVTLLTTALQELERARAEREERATLWPVEELPVDGNRSVISGHMRELMNYARRIAKANVNVLITGESGTGKEIIARAIHDFSDRAQRPFVPFNCTAIPRDLLESQLFGHRRGAFTGADRDHPGLIRAAREGTLFLDEIGELGLDLQPKLLRFLESGEIAPLGEPGSLTIDVRIVAATNSNLEESVRAGKFREDLFYRLNVVRLSLRPLRERRDEIPGFVNHFVARAAEEFSKGHLRVAEETMERLLLYRWPGNVRQLQNELRRMIALAEPNSTLLPHAISDDILGALPIFRLPPPNGMEIAVQLHDKLLPTLARIEYEMIKAALREHHGKVNAAAKALGISRKGLYLKRQRFGL